MLIAIVSDTHLPRGRRVIPPECVRRLGSADLVIHAGDIASEEALAQLEALGPPVAAVHGNVDPPPLCERLPQERVVEAAGARIAVVHDAGPAKGRLVRMRRRFPDAHAVVFGHSHIPLLERGEDGFQIFNPGSPTDRRRAPVHTMGLAHADCGEVRFELIALPDAPR
jgi:putative phosphoesterase